MAVAELQLEVRALNVRAVADAGDLKHLGEAVDTPVTRFDTNVRCIPQKARAVLLSFAGWTLIALASTP